MIPADDRSLLHSAAAGDRAAMDELVRRHGPLVLAACRRQLPGADADDAAQAVFLVLWRRASQAAAAPGLPGWLVVTSRRVCATSRRAAIRRRQAERTVVSGAVPEQANEARSLLDEALAALPAGERESVVRRHLLGEDPAQAAAALGCAEGTVHSRTSRGLERLRTWFSRRGIVCSAATLAALCTEERQAAESFSAAATRICASPSANASALATTATAFPYLPTGVLVMSVAALSLIIVLAWPAAVPPAGEAPTPVLITRIYDATDLYRDEITLYEFPPIVVSRRNTRQQSPPEPDAAMVASLDACRNLRRLCELVRDRSGAGSLVQMIDEGMSDEDLLAGAPPGSDRKFVAGVRRTLAHQSGACIPGLDRLRTLMVTADEAGHARVDADLTAVRQQRDLRMRNQPAIIAVVAALRETVRKHGHRDRETGLFVPDHPLPAILPETGADRFAVIWLPEARHESHPLAVATDGHVSLILSNIPIGLTVFWRPDLRPAAIALELRQGLDQGKDIPGQQRLKAPLSDADWRQAAATTYTDGSAPGNIYEALSELVRQAARRDAAAF